MTEQSTSAAKWYIIHTYSGYEQRVEQTIQELIRTNIAGGLIEEVIVPTEKVVEMAKGQKKTSTRKFYPGYVLVKLVLNDHTWHLVQSIPRVTGFVGSKDKPTPLSEAEAKKILDTIEDRKEQPRPKFHFERGDEVRVIDGPFSNFNGLVEDVNYDKGKLRVSVSIFGRQTPVELDFVQVTKS
jgi:transcription termination/antitermination protein NusG